MNKIDRERQTIRSALWAAYGDALGFITELADEGRVEHRAGSSTVSTTIAWRRKLSARGAVYVEFPAGTYSDDTQLRLATSRSIRADGSFDVASFAKVEMTSWLNYALGAGLASKEAAANLARSSATWYSNFFDGKRATYVGSGGNGAAMRVQPHVWAARNLDDIKQLYRDVLRNTISSHGHARAIVGACFHAATLAFALKNGWVAHGDELNEIVRSLLILPEIAESDNDIRLFWLGPWAKISGQSFENAVAQTVEELRADFDVLRTIPNDSVENAYRTAVNALGAFSSDTRGSATKTAILANHLAGMCGSPEQAVVTAANALGSDTDSIATMAGAILGACTEDELHHPLQDRGYIESEARRLYNVARSLEARSFGYPDLRSWKPERAAIDAIIQTDEGLILNGISRAILLPRPLLTDNDSTHLAWLELRFGQTILARLRASPITVTDATQRVVTDRPVQKPDASAARTAAKIPDLFSQNATQARNIGQQKTGSGGETLNGLLERVIDSGFDPVLVGKVLLQQADEGSADFVEKGVALAATILTAYRVRSRRR